jgi:hypothetical protein
MYMNVSDAMIIMSVAQFRHIVQRDCTRTEAIVMVDWHVSDRLEIISILADTIEIPA